MNKDQIRLQIQRIEQELSILKQLLEIPSHTSHSIDTSSDSTDVTAPKALIMDTDSPEGILEALFEIVATDQIHELDKILHSSLVKHPPSKDTFMRFTFKTFQSRWKEYLSLENAYDTFTITRRQKNDRGELSELKLYLQSENRSPCPITMQQDPYAEMRWKIISSSL